MKPQELERSSDLGRTAFQYNHSFGFPKPMKVKWSNEVEKSEMSMIWRISITNNVKSYKKLNEIAQTDRFIVFTMCGSWKSCFFFMKTGQTESHFWPQFILVYLGVLIGEDLTFDEHVNRVRGKLVSAAFMLIKANHFCLLKHAYRSTGQLLRVILILQLLFGR